MNAPKICCPLECLYYSNYENIQNGHEIVGVEVSGIIGALFSPKLKWLCTQRCRIWWIIIVLHVCDKCRNKSSNFIAFHWDQISRIISMVGRNAKILTIPHACFEQSGNELEAMTVLFVHCIDWFVYPSLWGFTKCVGARAREGDR